MIDKFMQLSKAVKMTIVIGFFTLILAFMYFTFEAGMWADFLKWIMNSGKELKQ